MVRPISLFIVLYQQSCNRTYKIQIHKSLHIRTEPIIDLQNFWNKNQIASASFVFYFPFVFVLCVCLFLYSFPPPPISFFNLSSFLSNLSLFILSFFSSFFQSNIRGWERGGGYLRSLAPENMRDHGPRLIKS